MLRVSLILLLASGCRQLLGFEGLAEPAPTDGPADDGPAPSDSNDDPTVDAPLCPATYTKIGSSSYLGVSNQAIPWLSAEDACALDGTHLIVLDNDLERSTVSSFIDDSVWIGLSDRVTEGTFIPVTDQQPMFPPPSGSPWGLGQPDNASPGTSGEDCVQMLATGELEDITCGSGRNYICECDGFAENPANL